MYNPLDIKNLGKSITEALLEQPIHRLSELNSFTGAGVYVIYYNGTHPLYTREAAGLPEDAAKVPIYVGKAVAKGARKGVINVTGTESRALYDRLTEHLESIEAGGDLDPSDFTCRYLAVDAIWIPLGESLLINMFHPIWNVTIDGFGNHDPGSGRYKSKKSKWDIIHPGREWAKKLTGVVLSREETIARISEVKQASPRRKKKPKGDN
ncbi:Eco29kI family restriction endonuclease [Hymenobacter sp. NST-14]|uniref:Eco29kI family restriction endonuclease n=1 Tax=Hymenobacter piscis TaxID=2839984 RepID=UPI001C00D019|nr:Eco29kI family restriction endonuclease [Hymenobacter piscis]MBT9394320.1 Eco29kI family restriction endonuclease [Hymenobacter piscis]